VVYKPCAPVGEESDRSRKLRGLTCYRKDSRAHLARPASRPSARTRISAASAAALCFSDLWPQRYPILFAASLREIFFGTIADALESALAWQYVRVNEGQPVPANMKGAGGLIVMGGPMVFIRRIATRGCPTRCA